MKLNLAKKLFRHFGGGNLQDGNGQFKFDIRRDISIFTVLR
jgi:hypothetical protein